MSGDSRGIATSATSTSPPRRQEPPALAANARRAGVEAVERFRRFWLTHRAPEPLGVFRIAIALIGLVQLFVLWPYLLQLYGNYGFIQWAVIETETDTWLPSIGKLSLVLSQYTGASSAAVVNAVFALYGVSLLGLLLGFKTRLSAIVACLTHALTVNSGYISLYGVDTMLHVSLFYLMWMPSGRAYSLDQLRSARAESEPSIGANIAIRTLQLHLCVIYLNTGLAKASGEQWWNGEAIWLALMQPQFSVFDYSWIAEVPWLAMAVCWSVLLLEVGYAVAIWPRRLRPIWLLGIVLMHLAIGVLMGLWLFSMTIITMNITAFGFRGSALMPFPRGRSTRATLAGSES